MSSKYTAVYEKTRLRLGLTSVNKIKSVFQKYSTTRSPDEKNRAIPV